MHFSPDRAQNIQIVIGMQELKLQMNESTVGPVDNGAFSAAVHADILLTY